MRFLVASCNLAGDSGTCKAIVGYRVLGVAITGVAITGTGVNIAGAGVSITVVCVATALTPTGVATTGGSMDTSLTMLPPTNGVSIVWVLTSTDIFFLLIIKKIVEHIKRNTRSILLLTLSPWQSSKCR